jgi:hypothetical protein
MDGSRRGCTYQVTRVMVRMTGMETKNASASGDKALALAEGGRAGMLRAGSYAAQRQRHTGQSLPTYTHTPHACSRLGLQLSGSSRVESNNVYAPNGLPSLAANFSEGLAFTMRSYARAMFLNSASAVRPPPHHRSQGLDRPNAASEMYVIRCLQSPSSRRAMSTTSGWNSLASLM